MCTSAIMHCSAPQDRTEQVERRIETDSAFREVKSKPQKRIFCISSQTLITVGFGYSA